MKQMHFDITLLQPLIISQQGATAGAHRSLDYLPGATLLGVAASRLYPQLDAADAFTLFHSGQVRFGDALPCQAGEMALPVPLSWHVFKGDKPGDGSRFDADSIFDAALLDAAQRQGRQPAQLRAGYVSASGAQLIPAREQTLKTAIDASKGTAAEGQLFGYEALSAGQHFRCRIQADDQVDEALWQRLTQALSGNARLGRSRSAQFGRVDIRPLTEKAGDPPNGPGTTELTLWLTSDLLLLDRGQPCLVPHPSLLGLPEGTHWCAERSFLRSRRYSSFNGWRRHHDPERQVICRGSVLRFTLPAPADTTLLARLAEGIGAQREVGLGQVVVNPPLLATARPAFSAAPASPAGAAPATAPDTTLIRILKARAARVRQGESVTDEADRLYRGLCSKISEARRYLALPRAVAPDTVPGRSQWGRMRELASSHRHDATVLWNALCDGKDAMLRLDDKGRMRSGWELPTGPASDAQLGIWLRNQLAELHLRPDFARLIGELAARGLSEHWQHCCDGTLRDAKEQTA